MQHRYFDLAFTPQVKAEQARRGSRQTYAAMGGATEPDLLTEREAAFVAARDSFYLASVSETGWPYVQHRGGPLGFVRVLDAHTLGWAEFAGNRQYISVGNTASDDRVSLFLMDYAHQRRLKLMGHLHVHDGDARPDLAERLAVPGYRARIERLVTVAVEAVSWNCPQHITPRFTPAEIEAAIAPMRARLKQLEALVAAGAQGSD